MISNESFRRFEAMLLASKAPADAMCTLVSLALEARPRTEAPDDAGPISIRFADLADRIGMSLDATRIWLRQQNAIAFGRLGFTLAAVTPNSESADKISCDDDSSVELFAYATVAIEPVFASIITGAAAQAYAGDTHGLRPDDATRAMIELIGRVTLCGGGALLYRRSKLGDFQDQCDLCRGLISSALRGRAEVYVPSSDANHSSIVALLTLVLHEMRPAILLTTEDLLVAEVEDGFADCGIEEGFEDPQPLGNDWRALTSSAGHLFSFVPHSPITLLCIMPEGTRLRPRDAAMLSTAVGPFRLDRNASIEMVQSIARIDLSDEAADRILTIWDEKPEYARSGLETAARIVDAGRHDADGRERAANFGSLATALAVGLASHIWTPRTLRSPRPSCVFYQELFVCDPPADLLFSENLRGQNIKILMSGEPGCGKSSACSYVASKAFGLQTLSLTAGDVLYSKLGRLERAISRCFREARDANALLIIDEADSLAQNRYTASPGAMHLVTATTNQLLIELDNHDMPVILATNFSDRLDPAVKRRVDLAFEVQPIPRELEERALDLILGIADVPPNFEGFGGTSVVADYIAASKIARLGRDDREALVTAVRNARNLRVGRSSGASRKIGF